MATVKQMEMYINSFAPFDTQEDFDNAGFLVGMGERNVTCAFNCVGRYQRGNSAGNRVKSGTDYYPPSNYFPSIEKIDGRQPCLPVGAAWHQRNICPTNLDKAKGGVNDVLAEKLGLQQVSLLEGGEEMGRLASYPILWSQIRLPNM